MLVVKRTELIDLLSRLQAGLAELQLVEAKRAHSRMPEDLLESVSAFSNTSEGGTILLGVDETSGFVVTGVMDVERVTDRVAQACRDELEPPIAPLISSEAVDDERLVIVEVPALRPGEKPCYIKSRGYANGAFLRVGGTNRKLTPYETAVLLSNRTQPRDDLAPAIHATQEDLDSDLLRALITRIRARRPSFQTVDDTTILTRLNVLTVSGQVTIAGLLALGRYPQRVYPQLDVTFTVYGRNDREPLPDGTRSLDSASIDGPISAVLSDTLAHIGRNMRYRAVVQGGGRLDVPDYPETALREALANALMHRDYSELAHGTQVRVEMFPDRIEIESPGGLYGTISTDALQAGDPSSSSRNTALAKLLEDVIDKDGHAIAENRGTGIATMLRALRDAGLAPPEFDDQVRRFVVRFSNATLIDEETLQWIGSLGQHGLTDGQVAGLALARRGALLTNARYRALSGCDSSTATRELGNLRDRRLLTRTGVGQRATWSLPRDLRRQNGGVAPIPARLTAEIRRRQVRRLLEDGPRSTGELAEAMGLGKQSIRNYLNDLRAEAAVEPTSDRITSPATRWRLTETHSGDE